MAEGRNSTGPFTTGRRRRSLYYAALAPNTKKAADFTGAYSRSGLHPLFFIIKGRRAETLERGQLGCGSWATNTETPYGRSWLALPIVACFTYRKRMRPAHSTQAAKKKIGDLACGSSVRYRQRAPLNPYG